MPERALLHRPRSRFVSFIAVLGILSGGFGVLAFGRLVLLHPALSNVAGLVGALAATAAAVGLWKRQDWARQGFIWVLAYCTIMGSVRVLRVPRPALIVAEGGASSQLSQGQLDLGAITVWIITFTTVGIVALINLLIIVKLRSEKVRREFNAESAA